MNAPLRRQRFLMLHFCGVGEEKKKGGEGKRGKGGRVVVYIDYFFGSLYKQPLDLFILVAGQQKNNITSGFTCGIWRSVGSGY